MSLQQTLTQGRIHRRAVGLLRDGHAELLSQQANRILEAHLLVKLEELEHVSASAAAETIKEPTVGVHTERWRFLGMERAEALVPRPRLLQRYGTPE